MELIANRFELGPQIGKGSVSVVYRARDHKSGEDVALKRLRPHAATQASTRRRFVREAQLLARLKHRHIVPVVAVGATAAQPWLAMGLAQSNYGVRSRTAKGLQPGHALKVLSQILQGLHVIHEAGLVHRDVKPANMLIGPTGAWLSDLGVTRTEDSSLTHTGDLIGSFTYMAPEQRMDPHHVTHLADVYSAGASLWGLSIGRAPPDLSLLGFRPRLIETLAEPLRPLATKACALRPQDRYPNIQAFLQDIQEARASLA